MGIGASQEPLFSLAPQGSYRRDTQRLASISGVARLKLCHLLGRQGTGVLALQQQE